MSEIILVSGLPRSGTSLMMSLFEKAGFEILQDGVRQTDIHNPKGYYEFEKVKTLASNHDWLDLAQGKVVKIVSEILPALPMNFQYRIIFMRRNLDEIIASQNKMLSLDSITKSLTLKQSLIQHLALIEKFLQDHQNIKVQYINYNNLLMKPEQELLKLSSFLGRPLHLKDLQTVIDANLYRNRASSE